MRVNKPGQQFYVADSATDVFQELSFSEEQSEFAPESTRKPGISMVFQEHGLFTRLSLQKNISFVLEFSIVTLLKYNCDEITEKYLARCFAAESDILLMDESFIFLDYQIRMQIHKRLLEFWQFSNGMNFIRNA